MLGRASSRRQRTLRCVISRGRWGFTLIEVLVVVAIIALLVAILLPSLKEARVQARRTVCLNNLHQMSIGLFSYQADAKGKAPQWKDYSELITDGIALWVSGSHATRLGMLYPRYIGKNENVFYCPDGATNGLMNKESSRSGTSLYPWKNFGTSNGWAYGSYEYRPRYYDEGGAVKFFNIDYGRVPSHTAIASDAFAGTWDSFGPFPAHTPIQWKPGMLFYNVAYTDGAAAPVKDFIKRSSTPPFGKEFRTRAGPAYHNGSDYVNSNQREGSIGITRLPGEYTPLKPYNNNALPPLRGTAEERQLREQILATSNHIERAWTFFDME